MIRIDRVMVGLRVVLVALPDATPCILPVSSWFCEGVSSSPEEADFCVFHVPDIGWFTFDMSFQPTLH